MRKKFKKNLYDYKDIFYRPLDLTSHIERVFSFEDGTIIKTRIFSVYPFKYDEDNSAMNLYGQKILNGYTNYNEELVKDADKSRL